MSAETARALDAYFIVGAEHGFNASTFTARVVTSTRSDIASAVTAAIGTMKGPLHGGAPSEVVDQLSQMKNATSAEAWVRDAVDRGEVLGLVGESGSGKSQTAFAILGLLPAEAIVSSGRINVGGRPMLGLSQKQLNVLRGTRIAYVPQEPMSNLDPAFTVGQQFAFAMRKKLGLTKAQARQRALALLARVNIHEPERVHDFYPHQLSGGMAQRVLIAIAVSCDPELLIADEPTTALDVTVQAEVLDLLRDLQQERSMAMVLVTHNFGVVADICDRVAVMKDGEIVETGETRALMSAPTHPYTQLLLSSVLDHAPIRAPLEFGGEGAT